MLQKDFDKQAKLHKEYYDNFIKLTLYTLISIIILLALLAIFVV